MTVLEERVKRRKLSMIVITELTANLPGNRSGRAGLKEGADVAIESDHHGRNLTTVRKVTPIRDIASTVYRRKER
jgi:hypothetical protein